MAKLIGKSAIIESVGTPVEEIIGRLNTKTSEISIAKMHSRKGWVQAGEKRQFTEYILVLKGVLQVATRRNRFIVQAGQAVIIKPGEWVQYSAPESGGARYLAICTPAYSPDLVSKDHPDI